eukprot:438213-Prorocentrum_minimum.AAC.1
MAWRAQQEEKYQSKRERADWVEVQKKQLIKEMMIRRQTLSHDQEMLTNALSEIRGTQSGDLSCDGRGHIPVAETYRARGGGIFL